jgi:hypothetical protein
MKYIVGVRTEDRIDKQGIPQRLATALGLRTYAIIPIVGMEVSGKPVYNRHTEALAVHVTALTSKDGTWSFEGRVVGNYLAVGFVRILPDQPVTGEVELRAPTAQRGTRR